ncbi:MAG: hypothetical protein FWC47_04055 [Oscillospiraceae bacterium]|nr:hypothetical protein [Oscillospiraceae bacterium]
MSLKSIFYGSIFLLSPVILVAISSFVPETRLVLCTLCCLLSMIYICIFGVKKSIFVYFMNSSLLFLIFGLKAQTVLYMFLFGFYAFFKYIIERRTLKLQEETSIKLIYFNISILFLYKQINIFIASNSEISHPGLAIILYNIIFILVDILLSQSLTLIYKK